jgi:hypothetical protein
VIAFIPLAGFLGAGKTTTAISAALALQRTGRRVAVVTNDQGVDLVDTHLVRSALGEASEIAGGSFSRRFDDIAVLLASLADEGRVDTVLAECVGTGADLQATLVRPLRRYHGDRVDVAPLTAVVDPLRLTEFERATGHGTPRSELAYLFGRQLADADILALNKSDLVGPELAAKTAAALAARHPHATVVSYSATRSDELSLLLSAWTRRPVPAERDVPVDYGRYSDAEAQLAWMNQAFEVSAADSVFDAVVWGRALLRHLSEWCAEGGVLIGHAKVAVRTMSGMAKLSVTEAGAAPRADRAAASPVRRGAATVNARIACPPFVLDAAVCEAVLAADAAGRAISSSAMPASFQADRPQPRHRLIADS